MKPLNVSTQLQMQKLLHQLSLCLPSQKDQNSILWLLLQASGTVTQMSKLAKQKVSRKRIFNRNFRKNHCFWSNIDEPTICNNDLLIYKISSTCFGQYFAHHQERETEIFTAYGILLLWWVGRRWAVAWHYVYCKTGETFYSTHSATLPLTVYLPTTTTGYHML